MRVGIDGLMSLTKTVPAAVPSLFHNSLLLILVGLKARKYKVPFTFVRGEGFEGANPGLMSLTKTVPAAVPSLFHNSVALVSSLALKYKVPFTFVRL